MASVSAVIFLDLVYFHGSIFRNLEGSVIGPLAEDDGQAKHVPIGR
jgi:hypothetical protein